MHPLFFGDSQKPLFGIYHPPSAQKIRPNGVVLCYPGPQEYSLVHWAFRRLAAVISEAGFHVLRFDYFGTGDSSGESTEGNISQWERDIGVAVRELADMSGARSVSIVGARLGATLAAQARIERVHFKDLVLWDPVVNGKAYIGELEALHKHNFPGKNKGFKQGGETELLGYPISVGMKAEMENINLLKQSSWLADRLFIVVSEEREEYLEFAAKLKNSGRTFEYLYVPDFTEWGKAKNLVQSFLINDVIRTIGTILQGQS